MANFDYLFKNRKFSISLTALLSRNSQIVFDGTFYWLYSSNLLYWFDVMKAKQQLLWPQMLACGNPALPSLFVLQRHLVGEGGCTDKWVWVYFWYKGDQKSHTVLVNDFRIDLQIWYYGLVWLYHCLVSCARVFLRIKQCSIYLSFSYKLFLENSVKSKHGTQGATNFRSNYSLYIVTEQFILFLSISKVENKNVFNEYHSVSKLRDYQKA